MSKEQGSLPPVRDYLKTIFFHDELGLFLTAMAALSTVCGAFYVGGRVIDHYFPEQQQIIQKNVVGNEKPDIYIEKDGVKYYSQIDGKDISDLVK